MIRISNIFCLVLCLTTIFTACDKMDDLPSNKNGTTSVLTASATTVAPAPADSNNVALTLNWTYPDYATDSANTKYTIQIDSAGKNFSNAFTRVVVKSLSTSFTAKELNTILLANGYPFNVPVDMEIRVISSYLNSNQSLPSNTVAVKMTPYKVPPMVPLPASGRLFIVGDASDFGWTNDPTPPFPATRELTRTSETTWEAIFNMKGSGGYKLLQTQGVWGTQFHMVDGGTADAGSFVQADADPSFSSPAVAGAYRVVFDFQSGKYTVTKVDNAVPTDLYITGNATPAGWVNNPPDPQKFTGITNGVFELTMAFTGNGSFKFLSSSGNWQPQYGGDSNTGGEISPDYNNPPAIASPAVAGNYKIQVNFITNTYTITKL